MKQLFESNKSKIITKCWKLAEKRGKALDLSGQSIGSAEAEVLAGSLKINSTFLDLDLSHNNIGNEGAIALAKSIEENGSLRTLNLSYNNIGFEGITALIRALGKNHTLRTLEMAGNRVDRGRIWVDELELMGYDDLLHSAFSEGLGNNFSLTTLNLEDAGMKYKDVIALSDSIDYGSALVSLNLKKSNILQGDREKLLEYIKDKHTLVSLQLDIDMYEEKRTEKVEGSLVRSRLPSGLKKEKKGSSVARAAPAPARTPAPKAQSELSQAYSTKPDKKEVQKKDSKDSALLAKKIMMFKLQLDQICDRRDIDIHDYSKRRSALAPVESADPETIHDATESKSDYQKQPAEDVEVFSKVSLTGSDLFHLLGAKVEPREQQKEKQAILELAISDNQKVLLSKNKDCQLPVDIAISKVDEKRMSAKLIVDMQDATEKQLDERDEIFLKKIEEKLEGQVDLGERKSKEKTGEGVAGIGTRIASASADTWWAFVRKVRAEAKKLEKTIYESPLMPQDVGSKCFPDTNDEKIKLFKEFVHSQLSIEFIKSTAIYSGEAESSMKKITWGQRTSSATAFVLSFFLPAVQAVSTTINTSTEAAYRHENFLKNRKHCLGIKTIEQLSMLSEYVEWALIYRHQDFLTHKEFVLSKKDIQMFAKTLVRRMFIYTEKLNVSSEWLKRPKEAWGKYSTGEDADSKKDREEVWRRLGKKWINLKKNPDPSLVADLEFTPEVAAQIARNLVAGTTLLEVGKQSKFRGADALIRLRRNDGEEDEYVRVDKICHSPAVQLCATEDYDYEACYDEGVSWEAGKYGVMYIETNEASKVHSWKASSAWEGSLFIKPGELLGASSMERLRQELRKEKEKGKSLTKALFRSQRFYDDGPVAKGGLKERAGEARQGAPKALALIAKPRLKVGSVFAASDGKSDSVKGQQEGWDSLKLELLGGGPDEDETFFEQASDRKSIAEQKKGLVKLKATTEHPLMRIFEKEDPEPVVSDLVSDRLLASHSRLLGGGPLIRESVRTSSMSDSQKLETSLSQT